MASPPHFVIFPFMSKGHTIPLLHLARLLNLHSVAVTIFTTPKNSPFVRRTLTDTNISVVDLSFPEQLPGLPPGVESTDQLPSMSLFVPFANASKLLQPRFEQILGTLPFVTCMISDGFLGWTLESASRFGIPRIVSYGMSCYSTVVRRECMKKLKDNLHIDKPFTLAHFPWIKITKDEHVVEDSFMEVGNPLHEFVIEQIKATSNSWGILFNGLYEIEAPYVDYLNRPEDAAPKSWCLGPLCLADRPRVQSLDMPLWMQWLDSRKGSALYIAFGSQANVPIEQLREIAVGLERANLSFLWVVRSKEMVFEEGFCERTKDRGLVVRDWIDQTAVLGHESVGGFLSHCGWNSVLEGICAAVPILAWPMMAEQFLNAKMVEEELGIGLRIQVDENIGGNGLVESEKVEKMARELMLGDKGREARNKVKSIAEAAKMAMEEGGSSRRTLDRLIDEVCSMRLGQL